LQKDVIISEGEDDFPVLTDKGVPDERMLKFTGQVGGLVGDF